MNTHRQVGKQMSARLATQAQAYLGMAGFEANGALSFALEKFRKTFGKSRAFTFWMEAVEASHGQAQPQWVRPTGQVMRRAQVMALDSSAGRATGRASDWEYV